MAKPKSLVLSMTVDQALKRHACQHNSKHVISKGDLRLKIAAGRSHEHYCIACAEKFINLALLRLQELRNELAQDQAASGAVA